MSRLQSGGTISVSDINAELRRAWNTPWNFLDGEVQFLLNYKTGQLNFSDFYGKQRFIDRGVFLGGFCSGTTKVNFYADGNGGQYSVETPNSSECGYAPPPTTSHPPYGTVIEQYCSGSSLITIFADGNGGTQSSEQPNSSSCVVDWGNQG